MSEPIYIVIGTRAQFIKVAPVMREFLDRGIRYNLIYTAQHQENIQEVLSLYGLPEPDVTLYHHHEASSRSSFMRWFFVIFWKALFQTKKFIPKKGNLITHGDTFTTWIGAVMGKRSKCSVAHLESGLRSFNYFQPFPEEICRVITFRLSDVYFCNDQWALENLKKYKGVKINLGANTIVDAVRFALSRPFTTSYNFSQSPYVLVSIHRYENLFTRRFHEFIIPTLRDISREYQLVLTMHPVTRNRLKKTGLFPILQDLPNVILHERFIFIDWIKLCSQASFVITDGGSNQEELNYLGVPTLLFRSFTERQEGLHRNVVLSAFDKDIIQNFIANHEKYRFEMDLGKAHPSKALVDYFAAGE